MTMTKEDADRESSIIESIFNIVFLIFNLQLI